MLIVDRIRRLSFWSSFLPHIASLWPNNLLLPCYYYFGFRRPSPPWKLEELKPRILLTFIIDVLERATYSFQNAPATIFVVNGMSSACNVPSINMADLVSKFIHQERLLTLDTVKSCPQSTELLLFSILPFPS